MTKEECWYKVFDYTGRTKVTVLILKYVFYVCQNKTQTADSCKRLLNVLATHRYTKKSKQNLW